MHLIFREFGRWSDLVEGKPTKKNCCIWKDVSSRYILYKWLTFLITFLFNADKCPHLLSNLTMGDKLIILINVLYWYWYPFMVSTIINTINFVNLSFTTEKTLLAAACLLYYLTCSKWNGVDLTQKFTYIFIASLCINSTSHGLRF